MTDAPLHVRQLLAATAREADRRPGILHRQQRVTSALAQLREAAQLDPAAARTFALALKARDLLLLERLAAEAGRAQRSTSAHAAAILRAGMLDYDPEQVRAWARENGHDVPARGRYLPPAIVAAWRAAHQ